MFKDENRHYSLRKLSVGLASVLIGISFASTTGSSVKADTVNGSNNGTQTVVEGNNAAIKTDAESAPEGQSQTPEAIRKDSGAITQDIKQDAVNTKAKQQSVAIQGSDAIGDKALKANNSSVVQEDSSAKGDSLADKNNALKIKAETAKKAVAAAFHPDSSETTLNLKSAKFIDPKTLNENKAETIVKADPAHGIDPIKFASNGGFDPKIWGTMDISKWQLDDNGNIIGYTGDKNNIIIPNSADFAKAGKHYKQISIASYEMQDLNNLKNATPNTLAISLTDNQKVKASDDDWRRVFELTPLVQADLEGLDTSNITLMGGSIGGMFGRPFLHISDNLTYLNLSNWNTSNVTDMANMFLGCTKLTNLILSNWDTSKVTDMHSMFEYDSSLTNLDVSNWDTSEVTDMREMFKNNSSLTNLDVSNWDTSKVTDMSDMFFYDTNLALTVNNGKFADYLVNTNDHLIGIIGGIKSVTTDNAKLIKLLTNDVGQSSSATRTIIFTFPTGYNPDLVKYHLTKVGNSYQIKQSADYNGSYVKATINMNADVGIDRHHVDKTQPFEIGNWQPNYDKLVLAHKNADGTVRFDEVHLPKIPDYKAVVKTVIDPINPTNALFAVSFVALPKPVTPAPNDVKPARTVSPTAPAATEVTELIKTEPKATISATPKAIDLSNDAVATTPKTIDLSDDTVATTPKEATWQVANEPEQDTYRVSNGKYTIELPHISNAQLHVIANDSTKDSILCTYMGQNSKYVFSIKFANGHYLLTTYKIKSGKLVKLIDYNFIKSSKMIDVISDWLKLK